jgi:hypothetical protein
VGPSLNGQWAPSSAKKPSRWSHKKQANPIKILTQKTKKGFFLFIFRAKKKWKLRWVLFFFSLMSNGLVWFTSRIRQNHLCSKSFTGESSEALSGQFGRLMIRKSETMNDRWPEKKRGENVTKGISVQVNCGCHLLTVFHRWSGG